MTNQTNYIPITYQCNGITKDFVFNWKIMDDDDLVVELIEVATGEIVVLEKNKYTVDYGEMGGSITTIETYSADYQLKISRNTPLFQNKSFTTSSGFQATEIEKALDKTSCQMQDLVYNEEQLEIKTGVAIEDFKGEVNSKVAELEVDVDNANETANNAMETLNNFLDDPNAKKVSEIEAVVKNQVLTSQEITDTILNAQEAREIATSANETSQEANEIATSANMISQEALDIARVAGLTPRGAYNPTMVYSKNDFVYKTSPSETAYYISTQNENQGHDVEDTEYWTFFLRQIVGEGVEWGNIVGDILNQRDLKAKFDDINNGISAVDERVDEANERINDLEVSKLPNATIIGTPHIEGPYVSGFSESNYLQFPFVDISQGLPFDIYFPFTTGINITTQQNILDSYFGLALAIQNGKGVMALSSNGSSWDIGVVTGSYNLQPNTTYYAKLSWTGTQYTTALSTDGKTYTTDMAVNSNLTIHKTTIYIGGSPNLFGADSAHPFKGTINFKDAKVIVNDIEVWNGYSDIGFQTRANVSLSNLDETGETKIRNSVYHSPAITNCLTEIPQRIKLELNNGVLTLKAGSVVIVPNGFEADGTTPKFDHVEIESDIIDTNTYGGTNPNRVIFIDLTSNAIGAASTTASGSSSTTSQYTLYYNVSTNKVGVTGNGTTIDYSTKRTFPICLTTVAISGVITNSINLIFNGMGYIGSTLWLDKGVKGLIPDGRNEDGTLKNIEVETKKVTTLTNPHGASQSGFSRFMLSKNGSINIAHRYIVSTVEPTTTYTNWYNPDTNILQYNGSIASNWEQRYCTPIAHDEYEFSNVGGVVTTIFTGLDIYKPFRAIDYNNKSEISSWFAPDFTRKIQLTVSASGSIYIAPATGLFHVLGSATQSGGGIALSVDALYAVVSGGSNFMRQQWSGTGSSLLTAFINVKRGQEVHLYYDKANITQFQFIYAEGEV